MSRMTDTGLAPRMKPLSGKRPSIVSVLDVGSSKLCCVIARATPRDQGKALLGRTHDFEVLGIGHHQSRGIKSGVITDLDSAERAIRAAVEAAERMAGVTIDSLIANVSAGRLTSETFAADISLDGHAVTGNDISKVLFAGAQHAMAPQRSVIHSIPIGYTLDGEHGIADPLSMVGNRLGVDMHVLTSENAPLRNLELCISRSHLSVEALVATPYAAGLACLVEDEMEMGCACIDIGAGTTTLSIFLNGRFVWCDAIAIGGHHVTMDIARGLSTRVEDAELIKLRQGTALQGVGDDQAMLTVMPIAEEERDQPFQVPRSHLVRIIRPRVEETLELIRDRLARSGFSEAVGKRLVLTGGGSQLNGMTEVARRILSRSVRLGRPMGVAGMPAAHKGPAFSTAVGLLIYPQIGRIENFAPQSRFTQLLATGTGGPFGRLGHWLKESF